MQNPLGWFTATHWLGEGKSAAGMWAAAAAWLMDPALQNWGTFGIRLQVVNAHKLWAPSAQHAVTWTSRKGTGKMS